MALCEFGPGTGITLRARPRSDGTHKNVSIYVLFIGSRRRVWLARYVFNIKISTFKASGSKIGRQNYLNLPDLSEILFYRK